MSSLEALKAINLVFWPVWAFGFFEGVANPVELLSHSWLWGTLWDDALGSFYGQERKVPSSRYSVLSQVPGDTDAATALHFPVTLFSQMKNGGGFQIIASPGSLLGSPVCMLFPPPTPPTHTQKIKPWKNLRAESEMSLHCLLTNNPGCRIAKAAEHLAGLREIWVFF